MAKLIRGPYRIQWGENTIDGVTEITVNYDVATSDYETVQGQTFTVDGAITANVELTLLYSDTAALRLLFPQYYKAQGETMSTGETVTAEEGAIDIEAAKCEETDVLYPLDVISCNGEVFRLTNAKTSLSGIDIDGAAARTVTVTFRGMPAETAIASVQLFPENGIEES